MSHFEAPALTPLPTYPAECDVIALVPDSGDAIDFGSPAPMGLSTEQTTGPSLARRVRRSLGRVSLAVSVLTGGSFAVDALSPESAAADTTVVQQVYDTSGEGLYLHPGAPDVNAPVSDLLPDGTNFDVNCWTIGTNVLNDTIWLYGTNEATGNVGYLSDAYINTPVTTDNEGPQLTTLGIPECGPAPTDTSTAASSPEGLQPAASLPPFLSFDRNAVANWALAHAEDKPPNDGSCTIFASQALWAGSVPQTPEWNNGLNVTQEGLRNGTDDAWAAENFVSYMETLPFVQVEALGQMSPDNNNVPDAKLGDIIAYDWNDDGSIDHVDVITGFSGQYPLVSGWSEDGANALTYNQRGWTYSQKDHTWLQQEQDGSGNYPNRNMTAYLIHFRGEDELNLQ